MCLKRLITAAFGSSGPFYMDGHVVLAPSLHRESTNSMIYNVQTELNFFTLCIYMLAQSHTILELK